MQIFVFDTVSSTMDKAYDLEKEIDDKAFCVLSASQSKGAGTRGRSWYSPRGNFYATYCLKDQNLDHQNTAYTSIFIAIAVAKVLSSYDIDIQLKWTNDLMMSGYKVGGILSIVKEYSIFIGIGINFKYAPELQNAYFPAGKIGYEIDFVKFAEQLGEEIHNILSQDFQKIIPFWYHYAAFLDQEVKVCTPDDTVISAILKGINNKGQLSIEYQGAMRYLHSAQIIGVG